MMASNCIFCDICSKKQSTDLLYEDGEIIVFKDIKPAAKYHFLAIPKVHIKDVKALTADDKDLIEKLIIAGKKVLEEHQADLNDIRLGFHVPPFNSISHLHLHLISPVSEMSFLQRGIFKPNTWWFTAPESLLNNLPPANKL